MNEIQVLLTNLQPEAFSTGDVLWYVEGNTVKVPKHGSTGTIQADGNIIWGRDGNKAIYEGNAGGSSMKINPPAMVLEK